MCQFLTVQNAVDIVAKAMFDVQVELETEEDSKCLICSTENVNVFVWKVYDKLRDSILEFKFCKKCLLSMVSEIERTCENNK